MNRRILGLAAIHASLGGLILSTAPVGSGTDRLPAVTGFAVAFALTASLPIHLEYRRGSLAVVLDEAVWAVGLFILDPTGLVAAAVGGEALSRVVARQPPVKMAFNMSTTLLAGATGASLFAAMGPHDTGSPASWLAALAAMAALSGTSLLCVSGVIAVVEGRCLRVVVADSAPPQIAATAANASIGLAAVGLLHTSAAGPLLLVPIVGTVVVASGRRTLQAAQHLRFERLYAAASRTGGLAGVGDALTGLASEARALLTGSTAVCGAAPGTGGWIGARVDDHGAAPADPVMVAALAGLVRAGETRTVPLGELPDTVRSGFPAGLDLVVAAPAPPARVDVILAVVREIRPDGQSENREEVLGAFADHAALVVANARLYAEVDAALHREQALGRQKSEFVAAVSHELRTPLTTVLGAVATIERLGNRLDDATQARLVARALDQGGRLRRLIDELLLVAAAQHRGLRADIGPVDVGRLVSDVAGAAPDPGGRIRVELDSGIEGLCTDEDKLRRIVGNLTENACKYAADGPITIGARPTGRGVAISVSDEGPGIPPDDRQRVFEPFVQLDGSSTRRRGGTGLGLYLCRQLADLLGADLDLDTSPAGGCRFTLHLPRTPRAAGVPGPPTPPPDDRKGALV